MSDALSTETLSTQTQVSTDTNGVHQPASGREPLLRVQHLVKRFPITTGIIFQKTIGHVHAVEDVSFDVHPGETLGLVGESGCGKTTVGRCILQLHRATSGSITLEGVELTKLKGERCGPCGEICRSCFKTPMPLSTRGRRWSGSLPSL